MNLKDFGKAAQWYHSSLDSIDTVNSVPLVRDQTVKLGTLF